MAIQQEHPVPIDISDELRTSFMDYAMSVIISRALPDVRDGLKPVHRRILVTMRDLNLTATRAYRKCAKIAGDVSGNYHPHGESVVYPSLVRMAQDFSLRYPLIDGQGNFGCFTGDTKIKLLDRTEKSFAELAELGPDVVFHIYSVDRNGRIVVGEGRNARITRQKARIIELTLDNGEKIRCTPDHRFLLRSGTYKQAQDLTLEDGLMPGYFDIAVTKDGLNECLQVYQPASGGYEFVHYLADGFDANDDPPEPVFSLPRGEHRGEGPFPYAGETLTLTLSPREREQEDIWHESPGVTQKYSRCVVSIEWLDETADVYDITVDEHHNFLLASGVFVHNSIDGDPPAAMRYTEARMTRIGEEMLRDITKNTVDYAQNYDGTREEPVVLPSAIPNLLVNGSSGIAVGMATNIPPHNLAEVVDALLLQLERPECLLQELIELLPGPDFPTGGTIHGHQGIRDAYRTGRGFLQLRARCTVEESKRQDRESIIVTEIPYQVNKTKLLERIAEMVRAKKIEGVADLRDESDREGMRIVLDLKRDAMPQVVLNQLYANTQLQSTFGVIMLALVDNEPRVLPLKDMLSYFLEHRREVIVRRTHYDLERAREREHILAGLMVALDHLDPVIQLIRGASSPAEARQELMTRLALSETQAQAILDLRLQRLTGLERDKILQEHTELLETVQEFEAILSSEARIQEIIKDELLELKEQYGDARRTDIIEAEEEINREDLIVEEDMVVTMSHGGYIKRQPISLYESQRRGGKGKMAMQTHEEDFVEQHYVASTHDYLLFFTNIAKVHWLKVYEIPQAGRTAKGRAAVNLLQLQPGEQISTVVPIRRFEVDRYLIMATKKGIVKKTELTAYGNPRQGGIIAVTLDDDDELIRVGVTHGDQDIFLGTRQGYSLRFNETDARPIGRTARGVIGIRLEEGDEVIGMEVLSPGSTILTVSAGGYGKRTSETEYRVQGRGGKGLINLNVTAKTGPVVGVRQVFDDDDVMVMSDQGNLVRLSVADVRRIGRNTQGVRLINLTPEQRLIGVVRIAEDNARPATDAGVASAELDTDAEALTDTLEPGDEPEDGPDAESYN